MVERGHEPPGPLPHGVQFYEREDALCAVVVEFLGAGLRAGDAAFVIATATHRESFCRGLTANLIDVEAALTSGQLTLLDARETLATFMDGELPDRERFRTHVGGTIQLAAGAGGRHRPVRVFGEMVDLLWDDGRTRAAIRLEELWTELAPLHSLSILCAYSVGRSSKDDREQLDTIRRLHTHVVASTASRIERRDGLEQAQINEVLLSVAAAFASELDHGKLVQVVTDEATKLTGAEFGAYFENVTNEDGESYFLYTLSGAPREAFSKFPLPRNTAIFAPTFRGDPPVRIEDVLKDSRYGLSAPYRGMPEGHLPVRSYLAVSVRSRTGRVLGGLFFGHSAPGVFQERHERLIEGLAAYAAIALDNATLYREQKEALRARDTFLSIASHELKTPLTPLVLQIQSVQRLAEKSADGTIPAATVLDRLARAEKQVAHLDALVNKLLDVSRLTERRLVLEPERVDLAAIVNDVVERLRPEAESAGCPIEVRAPHPVLGDWDRLRLDQVVSNVLSNALKYGRGKPVVVVAQRQGDSAQLSVRDQGIGISSDDQRRIFRRFERAVSDQHYGGFGLGLWISREVLERMGGTIRVESKPGEGATFVVTLPALP